MLSPNVRQASRRALNKQRESVDGGVEREIDQSRLPTGKRLEVKLEELRHDNESAKQLHRSVAVSHVVQCPAQEGSGRRQRLGLLPCFGFYPCCSVDNPLLDLLQTMKAEGANVDANGKKPTNFHRVNRLAIKVRTTAMRIAVL